MEENQQFQIRVRGMPLNISEDEYCSLFGQYGKYRIVNRINDIEDASSSSNVSQTVQLVLQYESLTIAKAAKSSIQDTQIFNSKLSAELIDHQHNDQPSTTKTTLQQNHQTNSTSLNSAANNQQSTQLTSPESRSGRSCSSSSNSSSHSKISQEFSSKKNHCSQILGDTQSNFCGNYDNANDNNNSSIQIKTSQRNGIESYQTQAGGRRRSTSTSSQQSQQKNKSSRSPANCTQFSSGSKEDEVLNFNENAQSSIHQQNDQFGEQNMQQREMNNENMQGQSNIGEEKVMNTSFSAQSIGQSSSSSTKQSLTIVKQDKNINGGNANGTNRSLATSLSSQVQQQNSAINPSNNAGGAARVITIKKKDQGTKLIDKLIIKPKLQGTQNDQEGTKQQYQLQQQLLQNGQQSLAAVENNTNLSLVNSQQTIVQQSQLNSNISYKSQNNQIITATNPNTCSSSNNLKPKILRISQRDNDPINPFNNEEREQYTASIQNQPYQYHKKMQDGRFTKTDFQIKGERQYQNQVNQNTTDDNEKLNFNQQNNLTYSKVYLNNNNNNNNNIGQSNSSQQIQQYSQQNQHPTFNNGTNSSNTNILNNTNNNNNLNNPINSNSNNNMIIMNNNNNKKCQNSSLVQSQGQQSIQLQLGYQPSQLLQINKFSQFQQNQYSAATASSQPSQYSNQHQQANTSYDGRRGQMGMNKQSKFQQNSMSNQGIGSTNNYNQPPAIFDIQAEKKRLHRLIHERVKLIHRRHLRESKKKYHCLHAFHSINCHSLPGSSKQLLDSKMIPDYLRKMDYLQFTKYFRLKLERSSSESIEREFLLNGTSSCQPHSHYPQSNSQQVQQQNRDFKPYPSSSSQISQQIPQSQTQIPSNQQLSIPPNFEQQSQLQKQNIAKNKYSQNQQYYSSNLPTPQYQSQQSYQPLREEPNEHQLYNIAQQQNIPKNSHDVSSPQRSSYNKGNYHNPQYNKKIYKQQETRQSRSRSRSRNINNNNINNNNNRNQSRSRSNSIERQNNYYKVNNTNSNEIGIHNNKNNYNGRQQFKGNNEKRVNRYSPSRQLRNNGLRNYSRSSSCDSKQGQPFNNNRYNRANNYFESNNIKNNYQNGSKKEHYSIKNDKYSRNNEYKKTSKSKKKFKSFKNHAEEKEYGQSEQSNMKANQIEQGEISLKSSQSPDMKNVQKKKEIEDNNNKKQENNEIEEQEIVQEHQKDTFSDIVDYHTPSGEAEEGPIKIASIPTNSPQKLKSNEEELPDYISDSSDIN